MVVCQYQTRLDGGTEKCGPYVEFGPGDGVDQYKIYDAASRQLLDKFDLRGFPRCPGVISYPEGEQEPSLVISVPRHQDFIDQ